MRPCVSVFVGWTLSYLTAFAQWEPPVRLTFDDSASHTSFNNVHCLAATEPATLHLAWYDHRTGVDQVFYKRSTDYGTTWSQDTALTSGDGMKTDPSLSTSGDFVHMVWEDRRGGYNSQVFYRRSTDNGVTWEPEARLNFDDVMSRNPCVAACGNRVHVAWASDSAGRELYCMSSTDNGSTWGVPKRLTFDSQESWNPSLAAVGSVVHLVWRDWRDHSFEVYYLRSTDSGATWDTAAIRLSGDVTTGSYNPVISSGTVGSCAHVVWWDTRVEPFELYYRRTTDNGSTWEPEVRLTTDTTGTYNPSIAAQGQNVHVAWEALYGTSFVMYKRSLDAGATWSADTAVTTTPDYWSVSPCLAVLGDGVHMVWTDFRDSEYGEIYYMRNLDANGVAEVPGPRIPGCAPAVALVVRGVLRLGDRGQRTGDRAELVDASGRRVLDLGPGANDVRALAPGVYFVRDRETQAQAVHKVVLAR
jgi:hypothetical protein